MKLIDKVTVVAEIDRLENKLYYEPESFKDVGAKMALDSLKSFLDTIELKQVDLNYIKDELDRAIKIYKPVGDFGWGTLYNIAIHFFELGLKAQKGK